MIYEGDCLEIMPTLADKSVDMILCDLPYQTTACKWDVLIPFEPLWTQYKRLIKDNGAIVLTASQPFTSALVMSNPGWFKYCWVWKKSRVPNYAMVNMMPGKIHEDIVVFSNASIAHNSSVKMTYNFQGATLVNKPVVYDYGGKKGGSHLPNRKPQKIVGLQKYANYPTTIIDIASSFGKLHPTQKPVALFEYLIRTYTNEGDTVLDNCAGSGTTGIACLNTGRKFILIEKDAAYFKIISDRLDNHEPLFA
jgi:site-specific DNA-methyltransferase (adenine-specific)